MESNFAPLLAEIDRHRSLIELPLDRPAFWFGKIRREIVNGKTCKDDNARLKATFNALVRLQREGQPLPESALTLCELHGHLTGSSGYRRSSVRVGRNRNFPKSRRVPGLVDKMFENAGELASPLVRAMYLQLHTILIHPFRDGNGRSARMIASLCLINADYRSTLSNAVEQHFMHRPGEYGRLFRQLSQSEISEQDALRRLLDAMKSRLELLFDLRKRYTSEKDDPPFSQSSTESWIEGLSAPAREALVSQIVQFHSDFETSKCASDSNSLES